VAVDKDEADSVVGESACKLTLRGTVAVDEEFAIRLTIVKFPSRYCTVDNSTFAGGTGRHLCILTNLCDPNPHVTVENIHRAARKQMYAIVRNAEGSNGSMVSICLLCCQTTRRAAMWNGVVKTYAMMVGMEWRGDIATLTREKMNGRMENPSEAYVKWRKYRGIFSVGTKVFVETASELSSIIMVRPSRVWLDSGG